MQTQTNEEDDDSNKDYALPVDSSELTQIAGALLLFINSLIAVVLRIFQLLFVVVSWVWFFVTMLPYLSLFIGVTGIMIPYVLWQDTIIEEIDFMFRCRIYPVYITWPRQLLVIIQMIWDPLVCYYDATVWLPFGIIQDIVIPLFIDCGFFDTVLALLQFVLIFLVDFVVDYIASFDFLTGDFNYVPSGVAWNNFWSKWQDTLTCTCNDLSPFIRAAWIITLFPPISPLPVEIFIGFPTQIIASIPHVANVFYGPILGVIGGNQVGDTYAWCALWSAFNGLMNILQQLFRILAALLTGQFNSNFPRPDFRQAVNNFCQAVSCFVRSAENVNQYLFDNFIPFQFLDWHEFLCIYDTFVCLILRAVDNILRIIFNIDKVINYPNDPFYETVVIPDIIYWLNLLAPPRYKTPSTFASQYPVQYTSWLWPTTSSLIPGTLISNPMYGQKRFSDCVCIYVSRLICNPADPTTPCYQQSVETILGPFDPCCLLTEALTTVADAVALPVDLTRHVYDFDVTTIFLNNQFFTTAIAEDLTAVVGCVLTAFSIIPKFGPCITIFFTGQVEYIFSLVDFFLRIITGLIFLAYYLVNNIQNFITNRGQALKFLLDITNKLTNATDPNSVINCACFTLNEGLPIPPVPCASCVPGGYIQPTLFNKKKTVEFSGDPVKMFRNISKHSMPVEEHDKLKTYLRDRKTNVAKRVRAILDKYRERSGSYTLTPTHPPTAETCTDPVPTCFDLCCFVRTAANLLYRITFYIGMTINSLAQDWDIGFPFFVTGDVSICSALCPTQIANATNCATPCPGINYTFEQALANVILGVTQTIVCFCGIVNEVIPITGFPSVYTERPDICCWVVRAGDLITATLLLLIKSIKELAQGNVSPPGTPPFPYFTQGQFIMDVDQLFEIQLDVVFCLGFMIRSIFPVQTVADLDVYCPVENLAIFAISLTSWITDSIISLGTIQYTVGQNYFIDPTCNWEATGCVPLVTGLQFYKDGVATIDALFGTQGGACSDNFVGGSCVTTHGTDLGIGGITQCVCQVVSTIFPIRPNPGQPTGPPNNCPIVDVCCPVRQLSFFLGIYYKFALQGVTTLWQRWDGAYPSAFFAFFFCDEEADPIPVGCGIINPSINALTDIVSLCICQMFSLLDSFLANFFPGFRCFCGGGFPPGIFCSIGSLVYTVVVQLVTLIRRANDPLYWQPEGYPAPDQSLTWAVRFFGPIQEQLCDFVGAQVCFITAIIPFCPNWLSRMFQSQFVWSYEAIIRLAMFLEGFITTFTGAPCANGIARAYGINLSCLTGAMISLLTFFTDALLADGLIACREDPCKCYDGLFRVNYTFSNTISGGVMGYDKRQPQPCTPKGVPNIDTSWWFASCCNGTRATYTYPSTGVVKQCFAYNASDPSTTPECLPKCFPTVPQPCKYANPALPMCNSVIGHLPMDGIVMAIFRQMRCLFQLAFGGGALFDGIIIADSVVWQLTKPFINVITSGFILILNLFIEPGDFFSFFGKVLQYFTSWQAFFSVPLIIPNGVDPFVTKRYGFQPYGGVYQGLKFVFMDYNIEDCPTDLVTCVNRNFNINCSITECTIDYLKGLFNKKSTCDVLVQSSEITNYASAALAERLMFINCVEKRIMGERFKNYLFPNFPPEMFYQGWSYLPEMVDDLSNSFNGAFQHPTQEETINLPYSNIEKELEERAQRITLSKKFSPATTHWVIRFDAIEWKIRNGYYAHLIRKAARRGFNTRDNPELQEQHSFTTFAKVVGASAQELFEVSKRIPEALQVMAGSAAKTIDFFQNFNELQGRWNSFKNEWWEKTINAPVSKHDQERRDRIKDVFRRGPIYQWFTSNSFSSWEGFQMPIVKLIKHVYHYVISLREKDTPNVWNVFGIQKKINATKEHLKNRFFTTHWTRTQLRNYDNAKRVGLKIYDILYPGHISRADYERFILDSGCPIINDSVNLIVSVYSYCANRNQQNKDKIIKTVDEKVHMMVFGHHVGKKLQAILNVTDLYSTLLHDNEQIRIKRQEIDCLSSHLKLRHNVSDSWFDFDYREASRDLYPREMKIDVIQSVKGTASEALSWRGPRNIEVAPPMPLNENISYVGYHQYKRAAVQDVSAMNFNLYEWILSIIDSITGWQIVEQLTQFFLNFKQMALNPKYKCRDYPNVGLLYYVVGPFECDFPCNMDGRNGIGLEAALAKVLLIYGITILVCLFAFQSTLAIVISSTALFIVFLFVTPWVAYGFSVRCIVLSPTIGIGAFRVVPLPFLVVSAYPFDVVDDLLALFDKYINNCYDFIWPPYMFNSPSICPVCPARFDMVNCVKQVQIGDGLSNLLYLGYQAGGSSFCSILSKIASVTISLVIPGFTSYLNQQCSNFASPSNTYQNQLSFCFWMTLPSLLLPIMFGVIGATFFAFIIPSLFSLVIAILYVFVYFILGIFSVFKFGTQPQSQQEDDDDAPKKNEEKSAFVTGISLTSRFIAGMIKSTSQVKKKTLKQD
jgi:hypothetical protein